MTLMEFFYAAGLAVFLSVPVGPVGFSAGERLLQGFLRDFLLIALGCIVADVLWAILAVTIMHFAPTFDIGWVYQLWYLWVVAGSLLAGLGFYLLRQLPETVGRTIHRHAFSFGFIGTFLWPTTFTGIFGAFAAAHLGGWLPTEMTERMLVAMSLGVGTTLMWAFWWVGFSVLRYQRKWGVAQLGLFMHRVVAVSLIAAGSLLALKPVLV